METKIEFVNEGTITSPKGFQAGAICTGLKEKDKLDLGILFSEVPCVATGLLTTNKVKAAPVVVCQQRLQSGRAAGIVVNSGCANAFTGKQGLQDAYGKNKSWYRTGCFFHWRRALTGKGDNDY